MGIIAEIRDKLKKETVTKIHGQPTSHDLTILEKEIIVILETSQWHWVEKTMDMLES
jgi:hypothetical protein